MKKIFLYYLLFSIGQFVHGQKSDFKGEIRSEKNNEPLVFANIILKGTTFGAASDNEGRFIIGTPPEGMQAMNPRLRSSIMTMQNNGNNGFY